MKPELIELAKYRIEKAREDLESAKINLDNNLYKPAVNRSYYSIFHVVRALLSFDEFDSKKHSGIISYFNKNYIKTGKFDVEFAKILLSASDIRNKSDYDDFYIIKKEDAVEQVRNAQYFVDKLVEYINNLIIQ